MNRQAYFDFENTCSIWQGQFLGQQTDHIFFVLTFHADAHVPTIHGALYKQVDLAAKTVSAKQLCILKGQWNRNKREFFLNEIYPPGVGGMFL